jgi:hypothetical protein
MSGDQDMALFRLKRILKAQAILREVLLEDKNLRAAMRHIQKVINHLNEIGAP